MNTKHAAITGAIFVGISVFPVMASPSHSELEYDALQRLQTQLIRLDSKIQYARSLKAKSRLSFDYVALNHDREIWIKLISTYLDLNNFNHALDEAIQNHGYDLNILKYRHYAGLPPHSQFKDAGTSLVEREVLMNLRTLVLRMKPLIREAESFADPTAKVFFKYDTLYAEHSKWINRFDQYLGAEIVPSDINYSEQLVTTGGKQ